MKALLALAAAGGLVAAKASIGLPCAEALFGSKSITCTVFAPAESGAAWQVNCETVEDCATPATVRGQYVEARTASVYAGACHFSGEYVTVGREAVLAWRVDAGRWGEVDLAGHAVVALVTGEENLAEEGAREAILYLPYDAPDAMAEWARESYAGVLGEVVAVERADVTVERSGEEYLVRVGDDLLVEGSTMPNRECCKMDFNVWYDPFVPVEGRIAGVVDSFRCSSDAFDRSWSVTDENCAFVGAF